MPMLTTMEKEIDVVIAVTVMVILGAVCKTISFGRFIRNFNDN